MSFQLLCVIISYPIRGEKKYIYMHLYVCVRLAIICASKLYVRMYAEKFSIIYIYI